MWNWLRQDLYELPLIFVDCMLRKIRLLWVSYGDGRTRAFAAWFCFHLVRFFVDFSLFSIPWILDEGFGIFGVGVVPAQVSTCLRLRAGTCWVWFFIKHGSVALDEDPANTFVWRYWQVFCDTIHATIRFGHQRWASQSDSGNVYRWYVYIYIGVRYINIWCNRIEVFCSIKIHQIYLTPQCIVCIYGRRRNYRKKKSVANR